MKMKELYTARYVGEDGSGKTVYEMPLDWINKHMDTLSPDVEPTICLRKARSAELYFVDYIGEEIGCTLSAFDSSFEAEAYRKELGEMDEAEFEDWLINVRWAPKNE